MAQIRHFSEAEVASVMSAEDFVASCDEAFRRYGLGEMVNPARRETLTRQGDADLFRLELPGGWPGRYHGRKVIEERSNVATGRLGSRTAVIEIADVQSGARAVFDAEFITNMRTGAAGALGARYLARQPVNTVAILGTGRIARALALCADVALKPQAMRVMSRAAENRAAFVSEVSPKVQAHLSSADTLAACVVDADVILTAVPTPVPILHAAGIGDHAYISVMGGDARTRQVSPELLSRRVVVPDHAEQVLCSGEFLAAREAGDAIFWARDARGRIQTVGDAALNRLERLRGEGGIGYFSGMAVQDLHAVAMAWQRLAP